MVYMFLLAMFLNLLLTATLADIALGRYLDAQLVLRQPPSLLLPNGSIPNGAFICGVDGFVRRPDGTIPDGSFITPFVDPLDNGDTILFRDAANELKPKLTNPQQRHVYDEDPPNVLAQRGSDPREARLYNTWTDTSHNRGWYRVNGWWHYAWNGHALPIVAPSGR